MSVIPGTDSNPNLDAELEEEEASVVDVFSQYNCNSLNFGNPHPGLITEAGSLSAIKLPPATYPLPDAYTKEVISETKLSALQLEGVLFACQRHLQILPSQERAGFFLADGTGVGKGRQIAGIIYDNYSRGRTKHVWISISLGSFIKLSIPTRPFIQLFFISLVLPHLI